MATETLPQNEDQTPVPSGSSTIALQQDGHESDAQPSAQTSTRRWMKLLIVLAAISIIGLIAVVIANRDSSSNMLADAETYTVKRGDLTVSVVEQGTVASSDNIEIKCRVRGDSTVTWVVEAGTHVEPGDKLVTLDTLALEEAIAERTKFAHEARSAAERSKADVARAKLAIIEYEEGRFTAQLATLKRDMAVSQENLKSNENWLQHTKMLADRGFATDFEVELQENRLRQAVLAVDVKKTQIEVLKDFAKREELETLKGNYNAAVATHDANVERAQADSARRDRALEELEQCVITAKRSGVVIYPTAEKWKNAPDIAEGAIVHQNQILLLMPNLKKLEVKVGIHESVIDRVHSGLQAFINLPDKSIDAKVSSVAIVTRPAGWWTGNVVKYDTMIDLPGGVGLKPGMTAEVEVILARHTDVLKVPVNSVVEMKDGHFCWVNSTDGPKRHLVALGDSNESFIVVQSGLVEGDEVIIDPMAHIAEAQAEALLPQEQAEEPNP